MTCALLTFFRINWGSECVCVRMSLLGAKIEIFVFSFFFFSTFLNFFSHFFNFPPFTFSPCSLLTIALQLHLLSYKCKHLFPFTIAPSSSLAHLFPFTSSLYLSRHKKCFRKTDLHSNHFHQFSALPTDGRTETPLVKRCVDSSKKAKD